MDIHSWKFREHNLATLFTSDAVLFSVVFKQDISHQKILSLPFAWSYFSCARIRHFKYKKDEKVQYFFRRNNNYIAGFR